MDEIKQTIAKLCEDLFNASIPVELTRPDEQFGDYATNVGLRLAKQLNKNAIQIAEAIAIELRATSNYKEVTVAGQGLINLRFTDNMLWNLLKIETPKKLEGQVVVAEYSDPNPFKVLHAGHLYTSIVGDAIANLLEIAGATVRRVNFGGDVGLHVGKTMWAILQELGGELPGELTKIPDSERSEWLTACYIAGTNAYTDNNNAKAAIITLNKRVYQLHAKNDHDSPFAQIYWTCRQWSYDYFNEFYARIGSKFERYYPESEVAELGLETVKEQLSKGVFEESDGAIVFRGEAYGLHTRVFVTNEGLPTYEAKDIGLILTKKKDYNFDKSVVITGNEQEQYMTVVLKAVEQFAPELSNATIHLPHGIVKLRGGAKMSSRQGNILRAVDILATAGEANKAETGQKNEQTVLAAVKYAFLKQRLGADIIYSPEESVQILGNSGPYLQYAYARACSILRKKPASQNGIKDLQPAERSLLRKISEYSEVVEKAINEFMPHHVCTYLHELAQTFNSFYEHNRVIGEDREDIRLQLVSAYAEVLKKGLRLLNIPSPEKI